MCGFFVHNFQKIDIKVKKDIKVSFQIIMAERWLDSIVHSN